MVKKELTNREIIRYPLMGEKATLMREDENKLTFVVHDQANKKQITEAAEQLYEVDVVKTNVMWTMEGVKKAHIRLTDEDDAEEIASQFGIL